MESTQLYQEVEIEEIPGWESIDTSVEDEDKLPPPDDNQSATAAIVHREASWQRAKLAKMKASLLDELAYRF